METALWIWEEGGSTKFKVHEGVVETVLLMRATHHNFQVNECVVET